MAKRTYQDEIDRKNVEKLHIILKELPDYVSDYFTARKLNTTSRTRLSYVYDIRNFFRYLIDEQYLPSCPTNIKDISIADLASLKARDIERYMDYLESDPEKAIHRAGISRKQACISSLLHFLYSRDLLPENVCNKVIKVKEDKDTRIIRLHPDEIKEFLNVIEFGSDKFSPRQQKYLKGVQKRDLALCSLALGSGLRVSEIASLNRSDLNLQRGTLNVRTKGGKIRTVGISAECIRAIEDYLRERKDVVVIDVSSEDALFLSTQRQRMSVAAIENMVAKYAAVIGVQNRITPHALRRTFGTSLYKETGDILLTSRALGHSNINTTKQHYVAEEEEQIFDAVAKLSFRND